MPLISVRGLTKHYQMGDARVHALDGVDLDIERGEFVAIIGPSGSGKSTMMHLLGCLDRPTAGSYVFDGRNVSAMSDRQLAAVRNQQIGFVFQTFNLINRTSALDNERIPLFYARKTNTRAPARRALERVGLAKRANHKPNELSGGEQQRVAIARAIVNDPLLIFADEPTGNLDTRTGEQIMQIFRELNAAGVTIVLVTHEMDVAVQARRIVQMRDGKIISDRKTEDVLREDGGPRPPMPHRVEANESSVPVLTARAEAAAPVAVRAAPGANAAWLCAVLAVLGVVAIVTIMVLVVARLPRNLPDLERGKMAAEHIRATGWQWFRLPIMVTGLVAFVLGSRAIRRFRREAGHWSGARRARFGMIVGVILGVIPLGLLIVGWLFSAIKVIV